MEKYEKYAEYKDSGVEWLGEIPSHWNLSFLKYSLDKMVAGGTPESTNEAYWTESGDGIPWVSITDITKNFEIVSTKKDVTESGLSIKNLQILPVNTVLYSIFASLGKVAIARVPLVTNQAILGLIPRAKKLDNQFLVRWLQAIESHLSIFSTSNTQDNLNAEKVGNLPLFDPPLNEQTQIANFLDHETAKIDSLIAKQEKLIELLKEKRQAVISHAVTKGLNPDVNMKNSGVEWLGQVPEHWTIPQIGYHAEVTKLTGFEYTNLWMPSEDGEIIALRGFNIQERYLDLNKTERIGTNLSNKLSRSKLFKGDLVLPCTGTLGNAALIENDDTFHINQNIAKVTFDKKLFVPEFCLYWVTSQPFRQMIDFNNTSGMQPVLLIGDIRKLPIPLCSINEQIEIVTYLDHQTQKMRELIRKAESAIQLMQERRTALVSSAVTGKINVTNWQKPNHNNEVNTELCA